MSWAKRREIDQGSCHTVKHKANSWPGCIVCLIPSILPLCDKDIKSSSFSWKLRWADTLAEDQGSGSRAIYNGGRVVLKCSANYHLCIFGLGLRGLWALWAACQRWNRKEKCSWKRMRRLRAPDLWNSSLQMKCTLPPGLFFPAIFSISCLKKRKYSLIASNVSSKLWI